ncbi:hypothetical protein GCM10008026_31540 [Chelatococcus composti]|nr:hypothetical protein [Chelatococcus composti]GGG47978.1 hypothetical protein GCM10008026_31540 [Chelatococcus composti]
MTYPVSARADACPPDLLVYDCFVAICEAVADINGLVTAGSAIVRQVDNQDLRAALGGINKVIDSVSRLIAEHAERGLEADAERRMREKAMGGPRAPRPVPRAEVGA